MRDIVSCFSENAVGVSPSSVSCKAYSGNACISSSASLVPSVRNMVISTYRALLSTQRKVLITVTWSRTHSGPGLTIGFGSDPSEVFGVNTNGSRFSRRKKGRQAMESQGSRIEFFWDFSNATYDLGPEPLDGFYVLVVIDSEKALLLGDGPKLVKPPQSRFSLLTRTEHFSGNSVYSTRTRLGDTGPVHDIAIKYVGDRDGGGQGLHVWIDGKVVVRARRLRWNFRGNQTIFLDGLLVDMMWDVYDWFFNPGTGFAVFVFRTRSGLDSRLWLEEKVAGKDDGRGEFSLLIYASKSP
ncbi:hypothetical protein MLD38_011690 [Melastoma candidum]|uniref:Uncharacterized protein n=1 Tax=Melastoma candidum TaxID=119954 RepID=A0ACB9R3A4_9MYRT|nr:hypothetical protein MLD38_011690 [Melastoma candidum]